jgi:hypothetical protein
MDELETVVAEAPKNLYTLGVVVGVAVSTAIGAGATYVAIEMWKRHKAKKAEGDTK